MKLSIKVKIMYKQLERVQKIGASGGVLNPQVSEGTRMSPRGVGEMFRVTSSQISGFRTAEHLYPGSLADLMTPGSDLYLAGVTFDLMLPCLQSGQKHLFCVTEGRTPASDDDGG